MLNTKVVLGTLDVNGHRYIREDLIPPAPEPAVPAAQLDGMPYVIVRTLGAGVHAGYLKSHQGCEVVLLNSRCLWAWAGATCCAEMSQHGVTRPAECKFTVTVPIHTLPTVTEIIPTTEKARLSIQGVPEWRA